MMRLWRVVLSIFFVLLLPVPSRVPAQEGQQPPVIINELAVQGNRRVQEAVILGRVQTKVGMPFVPARLGEDIRSIFALGFFDDVQLKVEDFEGGVKVTFVVVERPFIRDIEFVGNRRIDTATLQEKIDLKLGAVYNPVQVQKAVDKLKDHYEEEGYFEVQIAPQVDRVPDGDVKVAFRISEGRRITIDRIVIEGTSGLTPRQVKKAMATQERQFFILRGVVHRQRLEEDIERIVALYTDHGYIQARVESHDISVDRDRARVTITIKVVEGPQFTLAGVDVTGTNVLPVEEVRRQIKLVPGKPFSRAKLRETVHGISELYSTIGRASVDVNPVATQDQAARKVNVTLEITEGPEVFVERINISGNVRSQEKILRREIPMAEGDLFTSQKLARARQRLANLGFFETVKASTSPGSAKDKIVVNIEVTERPTGIFSIGGGFSSAEGFLGTIDLSQRNFLGRGWEVALRLRGGANTQLGIVSFTEPWLFDRPLAAGFDLFNNRRVFLDFTVNSLGGDVRLSHPFLEFWRWNLQYRLTRDDISDVAEDASPFLRREEGDTVTSLVGAGVVWDTRDNVFTPARGGRFSLVSDVAGLGGDNKFMKTVGELSYFYPVFWDTVLAGRLEAGYGFGLGDNELPLFERFFLGGPNSIRGRKLRQISPVDETGSRIGGTSEVLLNLEHLVPVGFGIRLATFFDVGNVYGFTKDFDLTDTREAAGVGVRWQSPFGPIRLDWGFNLDRRKGESSNQFHFSVGSPF
ncbi:MAG: outer membrane protein assembly factor BamA [Candidatus Rokubacteria bacterium]|nr:outer membrane protein assembly factor BamA [Candidatus Rokubacteria bacterium]